MCAYYDVRSSYRTKWISKTENEKRISFSLFVFFFSSASYFMRLLLSIRFMNNENWMQFCRWKKSLRWIECDRKWERGEFVSRLLSRSSVERGNRCEIASSGATENSFCHLRFHYIIPLRPQQRFNKKTHSQPNEDEPEKRCEQDNTTQHKRSQPKRNVQRITQVWSLFCYCFAANVCRNWRSAHTFYAMF